MPSVIAFILIIASFSVASKYELKSVMKRPIKLISPSIDKREATTVALDSIDLKTEQIDTVAYSGNQDEVLLVDKPFSMVSKEVSIILLHRLHFSLSFPFGT